MNIITDLVKENGISEIIFNYEHQLRLTNVLKDLKQTVRKRHFNTEYQYCIYN